MLTQFAQIHFIGDSLTAAGRNLQIKKPNRSEALGHGWVNRVVTELLLTNPKLACFNHGIDGTSISSCAAQLTGLTLNPRCLVVVQCGINDLWWQQTPIITAQQQLAQLLALITVQGATSLVLEPICLASVMKKPLNTEQLQQLQNSWADCCQALGQPFCALQADLDEKKPPHNYLYDGIHATPLGNYYLANKVTSAILALNT